MEEDDDKSMNKSKEKMALLAVLAGEKQEGRQEKQQQAVSISESRKKCQKVKMVEEEVDKYDSYEDYLDSLVTEEDHLFLEDESMARIIAELGYRSSGDTLSRENFYKMKSRLNEKRQLIQGTPSDFDIDNEDFSNGSAENVPNVVLALRSRIRDISNGSLSSIIFMRTKVPRKGSHGSGADGNNSRLKEISGHIDVNQRLTTENILPYLRAQKRLIPRSGDLTYCSWYKSGQGRLPECQNTQSFEVNVSGKGLTIEISHKESGFVFDGGTTRDISRTLKTSSGDQFSLNGWHRIPNDNDDQVHNDTFAYIVDIRRL